MKAAYKEAQVSLTHVLLRDRLTACATPFSVTELYFPHKAYFSEQTASCPQHRSAVLLLSVGVPPYHRSAPLQTHPRQQDTGTSRRAASMLYEECSVTQLTHFITGTIKAGKRHDIRRKIKQERRKWIV